MDVPTEKPVRSQEGLSQIDGNPASLQKPFILTAGFDLLSPSGCAGTV